MTQTLRKPRGIPFASAALFLIAYVAVLMIVFAPEDRFTATPGSQQTTD